MSAPDERHELDITLRGVPSPVPSIRAEVAREMAAAYARCTEEHPACLAQCVLRKGHDGRHSMSCDPYARSGWRLL